jgi:parallel beta-helix repeat protein
MGKSVKIIASFRSVFFSGLGLLGLLLVARLAHASSRIELNARRFSSLQAAVNALSYSGGTVTLPCGTYGAVTISQPNVSLVGAGNCSVITAAAAGDNGIVTVTNGATDTVISNLQIQGQAVDQSTIQRCIYLTGGSTGTLIEQVKFGGTTSSNGCNIHIHSDSTSSRNVITNNTLTQAIGTGSGGGYGMLIETSNGNTITHNVSIQTATQGRHHVYLSAGSSSNVVMNNQFSGGTSDQIVIYALDTQPTGEYNLIENNVLTGMGNGLGAEAAIHICQNATYNRVIGNQVFESTVTGIEVEASTVEGESHANNNDIENNQVYFAGEFGIEILGSSNNTIKGNTVYEASQSSSDEYGGIEVSSDGEYATAQNNQITGNTSYGSETQRNGLQIDSGAPQPSETVVTQNRFGIGVSGSAFYNGGNGTVIGSNVLNYQNANPPKQ